MITGFVFVMMLVIEYINVQTQGILHDVVKRKLWLQYLLSAFLGATPGCLGAFTVVALYSHSIVSFGALVCAMIATSGDEAFVMFAMIPEKAILLTAGIFLIGIFSGILTDKVISAKFINKKLKLNKFTIHDEDSCTCFVRGEILPHLKKISLQRTLLIGFLTIFIIVILAGQIGPDEWNWIRITLLITSAVSLFITITVPEHFLEEHLWEHIVKVHIPRIFLWTFGALLVMHIILGQLNIEEWIETNRLLILVIACLIGLIPESGPHLIFVTLFVEGAIPFSILFASSIVQDGHGMLPMLAEAKRGFFTVKFINLIVGFCFGFLGYLTGW